MIYVIGKRVKQYTYFLATGHVCDNQITRTWTLNMDNALMYSSREEHDDAIKLYGLQVTNNFVEVER